MNARTCLMRLALSNRANKLCLGNQNQARFRRSLLRAPTSNETFDHLISLQRHQNLDFYLREALAQAL